MVSYGPPKYQTWKLWESSDTNSVPAFEIINTSEEALNIHQLSFFKWHQLPSSLLLPYVYVSSTQITVFKLFLILLFPQFLQIVIILLMKVAHSEQVKENKKPSFHDSITVTKNVN